MRERRLSEEMAGAEATSRVRPQRELERQLANLDRLGEHLDSTNNRLFEIKERLLGAQDEPTTETRPGEPALLIEEPTVEGVAREMFELECRIREVALQLRDATDQLLRL